jgi:hypothetical protein
LAIVIYYLQIPPDERQAMYLEIPSWEQNELAFEFYCLKVRKNGYRKTRDIDIFWRKIGWGNRRAIQNIISKALGWPLGWKKIPNKRDDVANMWKLFTLNQKQ